MDDGIAVIRRVPCQAGQAGAAACIGVGVLRVIDRRLLLELKQVFDMAVLRRSAKAG